MRSLSFARFGISIATACSLFGCPSPPSSPKTATAHEGRPVVLVAPLQTTTPLFSDELALVQTEVEDFLRRQSLVAIDLVPAERIATLARLVGSGRTREGGPVCAYPPSMDRLLRTRFPTAVHASVGLACGDTDCALQLGIQSGFVTLATWGSPLVSRFGADVGNAATVASWRDAARNLVAPAPKVSSTRSRNRGAAEAASDVARVRVVDAQPLGGWRSPLPDATTFASFEPALTACGPVSGGAEHDRLLLSVSSAGTIDRCEPSSFTEAQQARGRCFCSALASTKVPTSSAPRRIELVVRSDAALRSVGARIVSRLNSVRSADADVTMDGMAIPDGVDQCAKIHAIAAQDAHSTVVIRLRVDGAGHPKRTELIRAMPALTADARACILSALGDARTSCTASGQEADVEAQLRFDLLP